MVAFFPTWSCPDRSLLRSACPEGNAIYGYLDTSKPSSAWFRGPKNQTAKVNILKLAVSKPVAALKFQSRALPWSWSDQWCSAARDHLSVLPGGLMLRPVLSSIYEQEHCQ